LESAHILDHSRAVELEQKYSEDPDNFPVSVNNSENGLLLCPTCHSYFDAKKIRLLKIDKKGKIFLFGSAKEKNYKGLDGKYVPWKSKIDKKDYPSSALLDFVFNSNFEKKTSRKRKYSEDKEVKDDKNSKSQFSTKSLVVSKRKKKN